MSHENQNYKTLSDLFKDKEAIISLQKGLPYVDYLIHKFTPIQAKLVPYTGGVGLFEKNEKMAQQGFITSEYLIAQNLKIKSKAWLVADEGFNPYIATLAVREKYLKKNPELVKKVVEATREGWLQYLKSPQTTNRLMNQKNPSMSFEMMNLSLTSDKFYTNEEALVKVVNPLSSDLNVLRQNMIHSGLETIAYNINRKNNDLKLFEFGKTYSSTPESGYHEEKHLSIFVSGNIFNENPYHLDQKADFYFLKSAVTHLLNKCGANNTVQLLQKRR
mgnify:CR=1 FL=1